MDPACHKSHSGNGSALLALSRQVLMRRHFRSRVSPDPRPADLNSKIYLTSRTKELVSTKALRVMTTNGSMRNAKSLHEWLQQWWIEQGALYIEMKKTKMMPPR